MKWPNLDLTGAEAVLWTMIGGVGLLVLGLTGIHWTSRRVFVPENARILLTIGAACVTWALYKRNKSG